MFRIVAVFFLALILQACANPMYDPFPRLTDFQEHIMKGDVQAVRADLKAGKSASAPGPRGDMPLHYAAFAEPRMIGSSGGQPILSQPAPGAIIPLLVEHGADPNVKAQNGSRPLHVARSPEAIKALIKAGADPEARDNKGNTALHRAANAEIAYTLLQHGADKAVVNNAGLTPTQRMKKKLASVRNSDRYDDLPAMIGPAVKKGTIAQLQRTLATLETGELPENSHADAPQGAAMAAAMTSSRQQTQAGKATNGERLSGLVIEGTSGEYMCPWTSDGVLTEWVDKAINAKMGAAAGSAVGAYAGQKAMEQVPLIGGFLGSKVGDAAGRKIAIEAAGGEEYIRRTSDLSFHSLKAMARYIKANHADDRHFQDAVEAANEIYPGLLEAIRQQ